MNIANESVRAFLPKIEAARLERDKYAFDSQQYVAFDNQMVDLERQAVANAMAVWRPLAAEILYLMLDAPRELLREEKKATV